MDVSKSISQLTICKCYLEKCDQWFIDYIRCISTLAKITSLYIQLNYFSLDIFAQCLLLLPNLDSLRMVFMVSNRIEQLTEEQIHIIHAASKMNKITKMNIEQMVDLNQVDIFINLCPQIEYLQAKCRNYIDLESIIRSILLKGNSYLSSLCFLISEADDLMVKKLQTMIGLEKLLVHYTIQRVYDRIYLQW